MAGFKIMLGAEVPNFDVETTDGNFSFHDYITKDAEKFPYTVLFGHPADYTPVCTTELGRAHTLAEQFAQKGCKLIGLSCDTVEEHHGWIKDILHRLGSKDTKLNFPIIADAKREMVVGMGMLDPLEIGSAGLPMPARSLIVIGSASKKVRLSILYPASCGRNFDEIIRVIDSLTLTDKNTLATPVDWKQKERCVVLPFVPMEEAEKKFQNLKVEDMPSKKPYLRLVDCPN